MAMDRRKFLKIAGLSAVMGIGGRGAWEILAPGHLEASEKDVPLTQGKQYAMVINMAKINDQIMDKCIQACHTYHNVPNWGNPKVEVKWLWKDTYEHTFPEHINEYVSEKYREKNFLLLCNHCTDPPCCRVCPTKATWKREKDGVVMMDMHRCIGCRFCMAACPYGSRNFNWFDPRTAPKALNPDFPTNMEYPTREKGVVEKCDFCVERIAKGQLPACVEAANEIEQGILTFGDLDDRGSEVRRLLREHFSIRRKPELGTGPNIFYMV